MLWAEKIQSTMLDLNHIVVRYDIFQRVSIYMELITLLYDTVGVQLATKISELDIEFIESYGRCRYDFILHFCGVFFPNFDCVLLIGIQDISKRSDLSKVLLKVEEKFRLDLTDEQAEQYFLGLINESLHSLAPKVMELAHKIAVSMR